MANDDIESGENFEKSKTSISLLISKNKEGKDMVYIFADKEFHLYYLRPKSPKEKGRQNTKHTNHKLTISTKDIVYIHDITDGDELMYIAPPSPRAETQGGKSNS